MKKTRSVIIIALILFATTGCWDRVELNDRAIGHGWGLDLTSDNQYLLSAQLTIPSQVKDTSSGGRGKEKKFFVVAGTGKNINQAVQNMQTKVSRILFRGQRRAIFVGEEMARHGIKDVLDIVTRDPTLRLRSNISVVKGMKAIDMLEMSYPYEPIPSIASSKIYEFTSGGLVDTSLLDFLVAATSEYDHPIIPVFEMKSYSQEREKKEEKRLQYAGSAIFSKDLKVIGFLNNNQTRARMWVTSQFKRQTLIAFNPKGAGNISVNIVKMKSNIQPVIRKNKVKIYVTLTGKGDVVENNTNLDLTKWNNFQTVEKALEKDTETYIYRTIRNVQKIYGADIFGFGEAIYRKNPNQWERLKNQWDKEFSKADVSVRVKLTIKRIGLTGPPIPLKEEEIKK
ncbi:spore germination protein GerKC [Paenibacillus elgii]|uniref:Ger(x)C family spore germination protein n=1 Tax=Paenibacillus elgii TaxID=189691 RepID=UPI002D7B4465|nr:spore germination protein GerKC [Paenibacillus elgii]